MSQDPGDEDGQLHTLGLLERLRSETNLVRGAYDGLYGRVDKLLQELENPNLHDIAHMSFRVRLTRPATPSIIRWALAALGVRVTTGRAALDGSGQVAGPTSSLTPVQRTAAHARASRARRRGTEMTADLGCSPTAASRPLYQSRAAWVSVLPVPPDRCPTEETCQSTSTHCAVSVRAHSSVGRAADS